MPKQTNHAFNNLRLELDHVDKSNNRLDDEDGDSRDPTAYLDSNHAQSNGRAAFNSSAAIVILLLLLLSPWLFAELLLVPPSFIPVRLPT